MLEWKLWMVGLVLLTGCSSREVYNSGLGLRQNECQKMLDRVDMNKCLETANKDYDRYKKEQDDAAGKR